MAAAVVATGGVIGLGDSGGDGGDDGGVEVAAVAVLVAAAVAMAHPHPSNSVVHFQASLISQIDQMVALLPWVRIGISTCPMKV